ncbi:hypothetical protein [Caldisericum sp.]|uniref:hypothetical protein n=1 Tax=Caldisericum sp. TaxID=2499687 RepID=UPI003D10CA86
MDYKRLKTSMGRLIRASRFSKSKEAQFRLKVVEFSEKHGVRLAVEAFNVSRATIERCEGSV